MEAVFQMMDEQIRGSFLFDEPMSKHTSWRAGGNAKQFFVAKDIDDLSMMLKSLPEDEEVFWLGLGSNTLVRDGGYQGVVIAMQGVSTGLSIKDETITVGASVTCAKLAKYCAKNKLKGAEFFAGIPGLMGGAIAMNAGAFGDETWNHVVDVETIDRKGEIKKRSADEFAVNYRAVKGYQGEWFVSATLCFEKSATVDESSTGIKELLAKRAQSQPIGMHSCGSVFKNPEGFYAAELIEGCGLKGKRIGGAVISEKHANFILNDKGATAEDIESLIILIQRSVSEKYNVDLHTEVKIIGEHK